MGYVKYVKLTAMLLIIASVIGGGTVLAYKLLRGDFNILDGLGKITGLSGKTGGRINALVLGTDESGLRTDFIMFASYNPANKKVNMISIPRDTRVPDSPDKKINSLFTKGKEQAMINEVQNILDLPIKYYVIIDFKGLRKLVDEIGGVPIDVPIDMKYHDPYQKLDINISKGYQVLDGAKAEGFVRFRKGYADADLGRIKAQHEFINALIAQMIKPQNIPKIPTFIKIFKENVKTNLSTKDMLSYVDDAAKIDRSSIISDSLPGEPKYIGGGSYFVYDKEKTKQLVEKMFSNEEDIDDKAVIERNKKFTVEVFNGTDIMGLGSKVADQLKQKGFNVVRIENYQDSNIKKTKIYERKREVEGAYVKSALKAGDVQADYKDSSDADLTVIVGEDLNN